MKIREFIIEDGVLFAGETADIKAMYKSIARNHSTSITPLFVDSPMFSELKAFYGLFIDKKGYMTVENSDTALGLLLTNKIV